MTDIFVNKLLLQIVRPEFESEATVTSKMMTNVLEFLPLVWVRATSGSEIHPEFADYASVQVDTYGPDEAVAFEFARRTRRALYDAWSSQTVYDEGHVSSFRTLSTPYDFPDSSQPSGLSRYSAEYQLGLRPPPT